MFILCWLFVSLYGGMGVRCVPLSVSVCVSVCLQSSEKHRDNALQQSRLTGPASPLALLRGKKKKAAADRLLMARPASLFNDNTIYAF